MSVSQMFPPDTAVSVISPIMSESITTVIPFIMPIRIISPK